MANLIVGNDNPLTLISFAFQFNFHGDVTLCSNRTNPPVIQLRAFPFLLSIIRDGSSVQDGGCGYFVHPHRHRQYHVVDQKNQIENAISELEYKRYCPTCSLHPQLVPILPQLLRLSQ
jgi:hypothetical protein